MLDRGTKTDRISGWELAAFRVANLRDLTPSYFYGGGLKGGRKEYSGSGLAGESEGEKREVANGRGKGGRG